MSRADTFYSLGLMPIFMGLGHLVPSIGAIHTATGSYRFPVRLFGLIGTLSAVVDAVDSYKDLPRSNRPSKKIWQAWLYALGAIIVACTVLSGLPTAIDVYRMLPLGLLWGVPCVPRYSKTNGLTLNKPKTLFGGAKSLVAAVCMAVVSADASMAYYCRQPISHCSDGSLRRRSFYLAVLYQFFRETSCDIRDIDEDARDGMQSLPVKLGKRKSIVFMTILGLLLDPVLTEGLMLTASGIVIRRWRLIHAIVRVVVTMVGHWQILKYPRDNHWAWGCMSLFGLVPVLFAQAALQTVEGL